LFSLLKNTFSRKLASSDFQAIPKIVGAHKPRMSDTEREALKAEVKMPCVYKSEEDLEVEWYIHRGHRLSEQDEMPQLCAEIKQFDTMLAVTTGGRPIAELLTRSARHRILSPLEQAIETQSPSATSDGFRDIEQFAAELSDDYAFHLLMCYAHIDAVRLCKTQKAKDSGLFGNRAIESHISKASTHITFATKHNAQSAAIAAAKCALCEISNANPASLMRSYEELIALDKTTYAHFRKYARALLAHPEIGLDVLDQEASKMVKKTQDIWGTGAYAWMYLDPLGTDSASFERVDVTRFMEGALDIFERCPDQHNANLFAGFAALSLSAPVSGKESATQRRNRLQLHETADWIIDTHLRELHPLLWLKGAHWLFLESQELTHDQKAALGEELVLRVMQIHQRHADAAK